LKITKTKLQEEYDVNKLSAKRIAIKYHMTVWQIRGRMRKWNIERRSQLEAGRYKVTDQMRKAISIKKKGKLVPNGHQFKKGDVPWSKGKEVSLETRLKLLRKAKERYKLKKNLKILARAGRKGIKIKLAGKKKLYKKCEYCKSKYFAGWKENKNSYKRRFCSRTCLANHARLDRKRNKKISDSVKKSISNHHIYLKENSDKTMKLSNSKHRQLHSFSYNYLVETGQIEKYIEWFDKKYGLKC